MPAVLARLSTCAPDGLSRSTMMRTLTPSWIMLCASETNLVLSPSAFWMSGLMPAAVNALVRFGRSWSSQREEDWVSGRITPTCAPPPVGALEEAAGAGVEAAGAGVDEAAAGGVELAAAGAAFFLLLQPAMASPATAATATSLIAVLFMHGPLLIPGRRTWCPAGLPSCCRAQHMHRGR